MEKEIRKSIKGFENYLITNHGNVISLKFEKEKILKSNNDRKGYLLLNLYNKGIAKTCKVHRLVATAFIPNPNNKPEVNHKDGNKQNNCVDNLEWVSKSENHLHAFKLGLRDNKGINSPTHKLTENNVLGIRDLYLNGLTQKEIGLIYEVSQKQISLIVNSKQWKNLPI